MTPVLTVGSTAVIAIYVLVTLGATMLIGADSVLENRTVALSIAAALAVVGSLAGLVEAASLVFLAPFGAVNLIAIKERAGSTTIATTALVVGSVVGAVLVHRLASTKPVPFAIVVALMTASFVVRPWILRRVTVETDRH